MIKVNCQECGTEVTITKGPYFGVLCMGCLERNRVFKLDDTKDTTEQLQELIDIMKERIEKYDTRRFIQ